MQFNINYFKSIFIFQVNDFPDFLSGDERTNTQHLAVTYLTEAPRRHSLRRSRRSPRNSLVDLHGDRSNTSTPMGYVSSTESWSEDYGYITQSLSSLHLARPDSRGSLSSRGSNLKSKKKKLGDNLDESNLRSLKENILEDIEEDDRMSVLDRTARSRLSTHRSHPASDGDVKSKKSLHKPPLVSVDSTGSMLSITMKQPEKQVLQNGVVHNDSDEETTCCNCFGKNKVTPGICRGRNSDVIEKTSLPVNGKFSGPPGIDIQHAKNGSVRERWPSGMSQQDGGNYRRSSSTTVGGISRTGTPAHDLELPVEGNRR